MTWSQDYSHMMYIAKVLSESKVRKLAYIRQLGSSAVKYYIYCLKQCVWVEFVNLQFHIGRQTRFTFFPPQVCGERAQKILLISTVIKLSICHKPNTHAFCHIDKWQLCVMSLSFQKISSSEVVSTSRQSYSSHTHGENMAPFEGPHSHLWTGTMVIKISKE